MSIESSLTFFLAIFIFGITPGPGVFAILARALTQGAVKCWMLAFGMTISDILYLIAACLGLAVVAERWQGVFDGIKIVGALYLFYLAWLMFRAPAINDLAQDVKSVNAKQSKHVLLLSFVQGFLISISNPKVILFYIAFLPGFMDITHLSHLDISIAVVLQGIALMLGLMLIAFSAHKARLLFSKESTVKIINRSASFIMACAGLFLLLN